MDSYLEIKLEKRLDILITHNTDSYSVKFLVRLPKSLHERLVIETAIEGASTNQWTSHKLNQ